MTQVKYILSLQFWDLVSSNKQTKTHPGPIGSPCFVHLEDYIHSIFPFFLYFTFLFLFQSSLHLSSVYFTNMVDDIFYFVLSFIHSSLGKMTRRRNSQQKKELEVIPSPTDLINMDLSKMSEMEFRITIKVTSGA